MFNSSVANAWPELLCLEMAGSVQRCCGVRYASTLAIRRSASLRSPRLAQKHAGGLLEIRKQVFLAPEAGGKPVLAQ
jgi:hypothetical protein